MKSLIPSVMYAVIMVGIPGAGKTTFATRFSDTFSTPFFNLPKIKDTMELDSRQTAQFFEITLQELSKTGQTILIEGFSDTQKERDSLEKVLRRLKYHPIFVWVQTDTYESRKRATGRRSGESQMSAADFDTAVDAFDPLTPTKETVVISGRHADPTQLKVVLKQMAAGIERPRVKQDASSRQVRPRARTVQVSTVKNIPKR